MKFFEINLFALFLFFLFHESKAARVPISNSKNEKLSKTLRLVGEKAVREWKSKMQEIETYQSVYNNAPFSVEGGDSTSDKYNRVLKNSSFSDVLNSGPMSYILQSYFTSSQCETSSLTKFQMGRWVAII